MGNKKEAEKPLYPSRQRRQDAHCDNQSDSDDVEDAFGEVRTTPRIMGSGF